MKKRSPPKHGVAVVGNSGAGIEKKSREYHFTRRYLIIPARELKKSARLLVLRGRVLKTPSHLNHGVMVFGNSYMEIE